MVIYQLRSQELLGTEVLTNAIIELSRIHRMSKENMLGPIFMKTVHPLFVSPLEVKGSKQ